jgi:outer membrane receptor for ferrienterochelin and colicin
VYIARRSRYPSFVKLARLPRLGVAAAVALLTLAPRPARAQGVADEAELHFQIASEAYARGDFRGAIEHFLLSNRLAPNRNVVYNVARAFEQMKRYADAHRYYVEALSGETDPRAIQNVKAAIARISPYVAVLDVTTTPPGATIFVDRKDLGSRGKSPRPLALPPGRYRVLAELDGYEPAISEVTVAELGKEVKVALSLQRIVGTVHVDADGAGARGATVHADDEKAPAECAIPCDARLAPGPHQLFFKRAGYQTSTRQITVTANKTVTVSAALAPLTGTLVVSTDERGAMVSVGGKVLGFTPAAIPNVPAGKQRVRITLRGYRPFERDVDVVAGQEAQLANIELEPSNEVTAVSRYAETIEDAPSSVSVIDGRELAAFGYPTIAEALRGQRGVYLANDRVYYSAGVRGVGQPNDYGNRVLVLSDGQSLNDNIVNSSYIGSDGRVDLHDVDRIELVRGPGSLLYGTGAFSGVVNLVTRPREQPTGARVDVGTYDNAVFHADAGVHVNFARNAGAWASASMARSEGVTVPLILKGQKDATIVQGADKFFTGNTAGRLWWGPFTVQWFYNNRKQNTPIGSYGTALGDLRNNSHDTRMMVEARFEPQLSESFQLMTRAHANRYLFNGTYLFPEEANPSLLDKHLENLTGTWFGGEARLIWRPNSKLRVTVGGEGQHHPEAKLDGTSYDPNDKQIRNYLKVSDPYSFGAGYGLLEATPVSWLHISAGARVDVYTTFGPIVVPRAAFIFKPTKGGTLKIMGGRAFRAPSVYERNYTDGDETETKTKGLVPESVYSGEIEYSQRFAEDWVALGAAHASYLQNLISTAPDPRNPSLVSYQNSPVPALAVGGDAEIRREWRKGWMVAAMYGYQYARYLDAKNGNPRLVAAPEHLASLRGVAPVLSDIIAFGFRGTLEAPRRVDTTNQDLTSTAVILDATVSGYVSRFGIRYTLGVYNFTGWKYAYPVTENFLSRTMPQNGRTFLLDVMWTYP